MAPILSITGNLILNLTPIQVHHDAREPDRRPDQQIRLREGQVEGLSRRRPTEEMAHWQPLVEIICVDLSPTINI